MFGGSPTPEVREELSGIMADFHPAGFRLMAAASAHADTRDLLRNIRVPTLLIWGESDKRSPVSVAYHMRDAIPGARLAVIAGAGHVCNLEKPTQFNTIVRDFCLHLTPGGNLGDLWIGNDCTSSNIARSTRGIKGI
jgi:pimeloyl-ACP methyl ester carboxylesterase